MSWHFDFNATTRERVLAAWDQKILGLNDYVRQEAEPEFKRMRECLERLIDFPNGFYSVKTYGDHCRDSSKTLRPTHLRGIFFEVKWCPLE